MYAFPSSYRAPTMAQETLSLTFCLCQVDDDLERASTLMALYDIRAKLKQQDNSSLLKAREKINSIVAKQQAQQTAERNAKAAEEMRRNRYSFPRSGL